MPFYRRDLFLVLVGCGVDVLVVADVGVDCRAVVVCRREELLLEGDGAVEVYPDDDVGEHVAHARVLRDEIELGYGNGGCAVGDRSAPRSVIVQALPRSQPEPPKPRVRKDSRLGLVFAGVVEV